MKSKRVLYTASDAAAKLIIAKPDPHASNPA
jgi:hypothetical protein